jgi:hypothetical protein
MIGFEPWNCNSELSFWILKITTSILKIINWVQNGHLNFEYCYLNLKIDIAILIYVF